MQGDDYNTFSAIEVVNYAYNGTAGAMQVVPQSNGTTFRDCRIKDAAYGMPAWVANSGDTTIVTTETTVDGCHFEDVTNLSAIDGGTSAVLSGVTIRDCEFYQATTALTCNNADGVAIRRNDWIDPDQPATTYAVYCQSVTNLSIRGNDISGSYSGVKISGSPAARIYGNIMNDLADTTVYEDAGGRIPGAYFAGNNAVGFTLFSSYPNPPGVRFSGGGPERAADHLDHQRLCGRHAAGQARLHRMELRSDRDPVVRWRGYRRHGLPGEVHRQERRPGHHHRLRSRHDRHRNRTRQCVLRHL